MWSSVLLLVLGSVSLGRTHHCEDPDNPYEKTAKCPPAKTHFCYNLVEDMNSFTCRCAEDTGCREPCGLNIFRAWSSEEGSWIRSLKKDDRVPSTDVSTYVSCAKVPGTPTPPHKSDYTMCMCNDHYYSYGLAISSATKKNFSEDLFQKIQKEKPKMYILGSENYSKNLPYVKGPNFAYRSCKEVSQGESYHPPGHLGTDWCSQTFCEQNNPYGRNREGARYTVMKCAETCSCFLEPDDETRQRAEDRNQMIKAYNTNG